MKLKSFVTFTLLLLTFLSSCSKKDDLISNSFEGEWSGTYNGNDYGTWTVSVSNDGTVTGNTYSDLLKMSFTINGRVNNAGELLATFGKSSSDGTFSGTLSGSKSSGKWTNDSYSGSWTGTKNRN